MKIAFVEDGIYAYASGSPTALGGAERDQWLLARALAVAGWSATVGVQRELRPGQRTVIDGVEYVGIGRGQLLPAWRRFLVRERPNWVFQECATHLWGALVEFAKLARVGTIFHAACDLDLHPRRATLYRPRWWPLYAWGLSRADRIFVQHSGQLEALSRRWRHKAHILPKVCDPLPSVTRHSDRRPYAAWVGTLIPFKRPDVLAEIAARTPAIRFVVCGGVSPSGEAAAYGARISERLRLLPNVDYQGQVPPERAARVIADAGLLLSTSDTEGFPNTFVQAWSSGTPVVTLSVDPDRIVERLRLGAVVGNTECAIATMTALLDAPSHRDEIAIRARRFVQDHYSAKAVIEQFDRAVLGGARS